MNTELRNAEDECRELRIEGYWFLPPVDGKPPRRVAGVLTFVTDQQGRLELFELLEGVTTEFREIPVIWGEGSDGSKITILSAMTSGLYGNPSCWRMSCDLAAVWVSESRHFKSREDVAFDEVIFGVHRLRAWDGRNGFVNSTIKEEVPSGSENQNTVETDVKITYRRPEEVRFYDDERVSIVLSYWWSQSGWSIGQSSAYVRDYPRIVIRSRDGLLPYYGERDSFEYYQRMVFSMIAFLIGEGAFVYDQRGATKHLFQTEPGKELPYCLHTILYQRQTLPKVDPARDDSRQVDIGMWYVKSAFPAFWERYHKIFDDAGVQIFKVLKFATHRQPYDLSVLQDLTFTCNGLAESLFQQEGDSVLKAKLAEPKQNRDVCLQESAFARCADDEELTRWLSGKIGAKRGPSFAMWIRAVFDAIKDAVPCFSDDQVRAKVIDYVKLVRQAGAHALSAEAVYVYKDPELLVYMTIFMYHLLRIMIVYRCGVSLQDIRKALTAPMAQFKFYDQQIKEKMTVWTKPKKG